METPVHPIRLRQPWLSEPVTDGIMLYRRFGLPSHLLPEQTVWLCLPKLASITTLSLNDQLLHDCQEFRWDITARLKERNEIRVMLCDPHEAELLGQEVKLEIQ